MCIYISPLPVPALAPPFQAEAGNGAGAGGGRKLQFGELGCYAAHFDSSQRTRGLRRSVLDSRYVARTGFWLELSSLELCLTCVISRCAPMGHANHSSGRRARPAKGAAHCIDNDREVPSLQKCGEGVLQPIFALRADFVNNDSFAAPWPRAS